MDFEVDMLQLAVEQLKEILPEPTEEQLVELELLNASETPFPQSR